MLEIRRYQPSDHDAVFELHKTALLAVGAYATAPAMPIWIRLTPYI